MEGERSAILAVGAIMVDVLCHVPRLPRSGEGVVVESTQASVGGCAFNSANVMRQLGAPCFLFAPVGEGVYAGYVRQALEARRMQALRAYEGEAAGGERSAAQQAAMLPTSAPSASSTGNERHDSGACLCLVEPDGERTMVTMPGIERHFERAWFDRIDPTRFGCALASGYEIAGPGGEPIVSFFEEHPEIQLYYAPGPCIAQVGERRTARINALRPAWHLNDLEARAYTGRASLEEAGFALAAECGNAVVVTAGAEGAHLFEGGRHVVAPASPAHVADTVGAGDAHLGALVAARHAGLAWEDALALANRVAAAVCQVPGATLADEAFAQTGLSLR